MPNPLSTYIWFSVVGFYGISTIVGYLMPNPLSTYIWFSVVGFYGISTIVGYLMPNPLSTYIWFGLVGFYGISTIVGYLMPNPLYRYILNIYGWILWHINHCRFVNAKSSLFIYIKYMLCKNIFLTTLNKSVLIFSPQLNGFMYCYLIWIILFTINPVFAQCEMVASIAI